MPTPPRCAGGHRAPELADALAALGAGAPRLLGYADARNPASAPDCTVRFVDAPLDEAVGRLVAHIREVRPDLVIGHDALDHLTSSPDHRRAHQITLLAVEASGLPHLTRRRPETTLGSPACTTSAHGSKTGLRRSRRPVTDIEAG
ncbi:PIG-L deacetylase family protein [Streptomyces halstedii]|uniref:PIG-L deacetylase family protein n=1 Tax=Streptomyces halstedii TaxID=1944 RepID=UPI0036A2C0FC